MTVVELNRTFVPAGSDPAETDRALMRAFPEATGQEPIGWRHLLEQTRVVLLGEAGSGKTEEMQFRSKQLAETGAIAWFARIEELTEDSFHKAIETPNASNSFPTWLEGTHSAYLFLDAVDESRLKGYELRRSLRTVAEAIRGASDRIRIIISCRVSDWQPATDRDLVGEILPPYSPSRSADVGVIKSYQVQQIDMRPVIYIFAPLSEAQVRSLAAQCCGIADPDKFWQAIEDAQLKSFATRPRDVQWIAQYWRDNGRFGTLRQMIEENIVKRLREQNPGYLRYRDLAPGRAHDGATIVAGATALCRRVRRSLRLIMAPWRCAHREPWILWTCCGVGWKWTAVRS